MNHHVVLAFDYGLGATGVAIGQTVTGTARGVATLAMKEGVPQWRDIKKLAAEYEPTLLLVGLPLHMTGEESDMSQAARKFAAALKQKLTLPVELQDERLTSKEADERLELAREAGTASSDHELAAVIIFEDWFGESRSN